MKKNDYTELKNAVDKYISGEISAADLKHTTAPHGIYQQRNNLFMMRMRIVGGELEVSKLRSISEVMKQFDIGSVHITTRQDIQLHDVKSEKIIPIVEKLTAQGMPFRGGGGNTFRNIIVSTESGLIKDSVFDVYPYAKALNEYMMNYDKAFDLPRKLKIGFSSSASDTIHADLQDLGFIARTYRSKKGFKVYAGGGMGRESRHGVKLFNFLPLNKVAQCAKAMTDLFYDHGDRENRNKARLRFVLNRLGEDAFISMFQHYYLRSLADIPSLSETDWHKEVAILNIIESKKGDIQGFKEWKDYAVSTTDLGDNIVSVKLFVPKGNLKFSHLDKIIKLLEAAGCCYLRFTASQDIVIPAVLKDSLPAIYSKLKSGFGDIDLIFDSFKGHLISCIGSDVCKIGIVNAPYFANIIADKLDEYFNTRPLEKFEFINKVLPNIRISGCPNTCSGHFASKIGLLGMKKKIDGKMTEGLILKEQGIEGETFIPESEVAETVINELILL